MEERAQYHLPVWRSRRLFIIGVVLMFMLLGFPTSLQAASPEYYLVRLPFKDRFQLQSWVDGGLDVWQVDEGMALVAVTERQRHMLKAEGYELQSVAGPMGVAFPACYRTYDDMLTFLHEREALYPELIRFFDVGDTWETRDGLASRNLYVVRVTSPQGPEKKPKLFLVAEHHAREIITPEIALDFIDDLLNEYGDDPTVTWLLDHREVWVMPMANPDGHARTAQLENWRKNTKPTAACDRGVPPNSYGVDLNRNYAYQWGQASGSSAEPCNLTYRGSEPFSEPETQAIRDLILQERFDLLVSLHSWGNVVLYPWGYTFHPAPDVENLHWIAERMASDAGYSAAQSALGVHYLSSGDLTDWTYGALGIPSFTLEVGGIEDGGFWPACDMQGPLYQEVRPALLYAAMAADHPYQVAGGPEARQIVIEVNEPQIAVRSRISDQWTGGDLVESAELFLEQVGEPGTGTALVPSDGECDSQSEWLMTSLDEDVFMQYAGRRVPLFVVAQDITGRRGVPVVTWLDLRGYPAPQSQRVRLWAAGARDPIFEITDGYVYQGPAEAGHVLMTVRDNRVYRGPGTMGELLYTLEDGQVRAGEAGPVLFTVQGDEIYHGQAESGVILYRIEGERLLDGGTAGGVVVFTANVGLAGRAREAPVLLLPVLADKRY